MTVQHTRAFHVVDNRSGDQARSTPPDLAPSLLSKIWIWIWIWILSNAVKQLIENRKQNNRILNWNRNGKKIKSRMFSEFDGGRRVEALRYLSLYLNSADLLGSVNTRLFEF